MFKITRRRILATGASIIGSAGLGQITQASADQISANSCTTQLIPTRGWVNIPEYKWGTPARTSFLESGIEGERLTLNGRLLTTQCKPIAGATLKFWQADAKGEYDFVGYKLRGHQHTDNEGRFHLETIMPGYYGNPRHIHFLVGAFAPGPSQAILNANIVEFPTEEEIKSMPEPPGRSSRVPRTAMSHEDGILAVTYDIVLNL